MHACMYACMYGCMHVCMEGWMDGWIYVCMYVSMYVCKECKLPRLISLNCVPGTFIFSTIKVSFRVAFKEIKNTIILCCGFHLSRHCFFLFSLSQIAHSRPIWSPLMLLFSFSRASLSPGYKQK